MLLNKWQGTACCLGALQLAWNHPHMQTIWLALLEQVVIRQYVVFEHVTRLIMAW